MWSTNSHGRPTPRDTTRNPVQDRPRRHRFPAGSMSPLRRRPLQPPTPSRRRSRRPRLRRQRRRPSPVIPKRSTPLTPRRVVTRPATVRPRVPTAVADDVVRTMRTTTPRIPLDCPSQSCSISFASRPVAVAADVVVARTDFPLPPTCQSRRASHPCRRRSAWVTRLTGIGPTMRRAPSIAVHVRYPRCSWDWNDLGGHR